MAQTTFKGFRQVSREYFDNLTDDEKKGYLWLVRDFVIVNSGETEVTSSDIFFGTRQYGHYGSEVEDLREAIANILFDAGIIDESGETVNILQLIQDAQLTEGTAIEISAKTINVKVAEETDNRIDEVETNKNFLKVNEENELEVKGVDADATVTCDEIVIEGGPLAELAKQAYTDGTLPAGTSLQEFLVTMLCKEIWGSPSVSYNFTVTKSNPNVYMTRANESVPVGTAITVSATPKNATASLSATASGFMANNDPKGYKKDGVVYNNDSYTLNAETENDGNYSISTAYSGFKSLDGEDFVTPTKKSGEEEVLYVSSVGTCKYTVTETGATFTPKEFNTVSLYDVSNLNNVSKTATTISEEGFEASSAYAASKAAGISTASKQVTGYYPIYYGCVSDVNATDETFTESVLTGLTWASSFGSKVKTTTGTGAFVVAFPFNNANYNKNTMTLLDSKDMSFGVSHTFTEDITMLNNIATISYRVFYITNANQTTSNAEWTVTFSN